MELRVLGELHACEGSRRIAFRPVERRLLAALAVRHPESLRYDALADAVWGDAVPPSATRSLQTHVLRVRAVAGEGAVETAAGGYRLGAGVGLDVDAFETASLAADAEGDRRVAVDRWNEALALWRGDPYEDLDDWAPAVAERARLVEIWQRALEERCAAALGVLPAEAMVAEAEALVQAEPMRERRWSLLMSSLAAAGRRADALRAFDRARRALATELGISPGHELIRQHQAVLNDTDEPVGAEPPATARRRRPTGKLPAPLTAMIGRDEELEQLARLLDLARLVTLTGAGGVGKTRLALAAAEKLRSDVSGGVWFVDLTAIHDPDAVDPLVASTLGVVPATGRTARETVLGAVGDRAVLLVLDNCEHLLPAVADFVTDALPNCGRLRVLTTSREPLAVAGERTMGVPSLPVDGAATELFLARARDADPAFRGDDAASVVAISRRLDGIPLAIELAAARVRTLGIGELARHLEERPDLLTASRRGRDARHRTMQAAIDWSYQLLSYDERVVFEQLSVFRGRFELEAVEHVVAGIVADDDLAAVVASLVDKSMVVADGPDPARFRMLEPLRQYAAQRLSSRGQTDTAIRHARYFATMAKHLDEELRGRDELAAAKRTDAARDNLRAAFRTAHHHGDAATALSLGVYLHRYASTRIWAEPWSWCELALELPGGSGHFLTPAALIGASDGAWQLGEHARSIELADAAIALVEPGSMAWREAHRIKSGALIWLGRFEDALAAATTAVAGQPDEVTDATVTRVGVLALILNAVGRPDLAMAEHLLEDARRLGNPTCLALALHAAGMTIGRNDPARAVRYHQRAVDLAAAAGAVLIEGFALAALAVEDVNDDPVRGARAELDVVMHYLRVGNHTHLRGFARGLLRPLVTVGAHEAAAVVEGATADEPELGALRDSRFALIATARDALGAEFDDTAARGAAMTDDELVAYLDETITALEKRGADVAVGQE